MSLPGQGFFNQTFKSCMLHSLICCSAIVDIRYSSMCLVFKYTQHILSTFILIFIAAMFLEGEVRLLLVLKHRLQQCACCQISVTALSYLLLRQGHH